MKTDRDRIICSIELDEHEQNVLLITPLHKKGFEDDSIYEFKLPDLYSTSGLKLKSHKFKYISQPIPAYASIKDIRINLNNIDISDEIILYQIKEASRLAEVIIAKAYSNNNINFSKEDLIDLRGQIEQMKDEHWVLWEFVVYKATYESLLSLYITMATKPDKIKEVLSDLSKEIGFNLKAIKDLLDDYKKKYEDLIKQITTFTDPKWGLRGKYAIPTDFNHGSAPYHTLNGMNSYGRNYSNYSNRGGRWN